MSDCDVHFEDRRTYEKKLNIVINIPIEGMFNEFI